LSGKELTSEEDTDTWGIEASADDELVSIGIVIGDTTPESVLDTAEVLAGDLIVGGLVGE
jgi:hypothetical protein